ncbi:2-amino-4-hydroxy-6-hydroxymethyldihydropteridine diphosphokinase [Abyssalbus ytuae]|uniref:2-amino-4-hydroxy-6-hydroxymethyldihydropteridine pyrophosphokinase n=1 Tax=Abyssalbus ytuae TaxID=2926907 RepID=A0A9E7A307_9FLAO|nr:2-amino-4-hydroxy-6-hydroxymethyldihydropteridine diphosphokinase [Abyssalbus ytuae]UOB18921.1 2-amino-4-hydroxy-6-hydroxymethyldihydropteridine diphosphokinase [Abyssalbus ytuae]
MNYLKRAYLSLGSNVGNKIENLQNAVENLQKNAGQVVLFSKVYQTPSWGFKSDDFLNACIAVDTALQPQELLEVILNTEEKLGRIRNVDEGYTARSIDIDILFYDNELINEPDLIVPHPHIEKRKFVLKPLNDIAFGYVHPAFKKTISQLLSECNDDSVIKPTSLSLKPIKKRSFSHLNFIAIEGNIGAGKTTLANKIARDFNGKLILERFADNPFLPKFYADMSRYAFPLEMSFLADRYQQFMEDTSQLDLFKDFMVSDYEIFKSLVFAKITLQEEEFKLYRKLFNLMYKEVRKPDVYVFLYQNTERLLQNIKFRNRDYEQSIQPDYLEAINQGYIDFIKSYSGLNSLIIDISELDFVKNQSDYYYIIDKIYNFYNNTN